MTEFFVAVWYILKKTCGAGMDLVAFGRHKGKTYESVLETDFQYCIWALSCAKGGERT